jgi:hypothetical protein
MVIEVELSALVEVNWVMPGICPNCRSSGEATDAMLREIGRYAVAVVGLSASINFGLVTVLTNYDSTFYKAAAVAAAAVAAAFVAWLVSTRILRI